MAIELREKTATLGEVALGYAGRDWRVFPLHGVEGGACTCGKDGCSSPGKHPRTPSGFKDATTDEGTVRDWWRQWPQANVGIAAGRASGIVVVDIDPRHGGTLEALGDVPETARVQTGSGGWHLYFRYPTAADVPNSTNKLAPGVDVRGEGGYVVAPGSLHRSGRCYAWELDVALAELPRHLLERMTAKKQAEKPGASSPPTAPRSDGAYWLERAVGRVEDEGHGRNDTGFWLACQLRDDAIGEDEAAGVMADYAERVCDLGDHEYTVEEARANLGQAYNREARQPAMRQAVVTLGLSAEVEFTDTGNAARLARRYNHSLRYVPQWGWLAYVGGKWVRGADGHAMQCAKVCIQDMLREAADCQDRNRMLALMDHARRSLSEPRLQAMLRLARSEPGLVARIEDFDADPMLLNVLNGTIDLQTGTLMPHSPRDMLTKQAHVAFDADAAAPRFERFLREVFRDDADLIAFVQRALGYSMTGVTREQVYFTCFGSGANGKSTLLGAVQRALGDYAKPLKADALMRHQHTNAGSADPEIAALVGARFVAAQEPRGGELDTAKVKELTGGDAIQARELHKMPFTFAPQFKLWLSTNERPEVPETTTGIWRRIRLIPFTVSFEGRKDEALPEKLASEAAGILNWLIAGVLAWQRDGLGTAEAVKEATREYRENEDPYLEFFEAVLVPADADAKLLLADAYETFKSWQRDAGVPHLSDKQFAKQAEGRGHRKVRSNGKRWLAGCRVERAACSADSADNGGFSPNPSMKDNIERFTPNRPESTLATLPAAAEVTVDWCQNPGEHRDQWEVDAYGTHCLACLPF